MVCSCWLGSGSPRSISRSTTCLRPLTMARSCQLWEHDKESGQKSTWNVSDAEISWQCKSCAVFDYYFFLEKVWKMTKLLNLLCWGAHAIFTKCVCVYSQAHVRMCGCVCVPMCFYVCVSVITCNLFHLSLSLSLSRLSISRLWLPRCVSSQVSINPAHRCSISHHESRPIVPSWVPLHLPSLYSGCCLWWSPPKLAPRWRKMLLDQRIFRRNKLIAHFPK